MSPCKPTARACESHVWCPGLGPARPGDGVRRTGARRRRAESGFSLLELFITMSLIGLFLGAVQESLVVGLRAANAADEREDVRLQVSNALDRLIRESSLASNVTRANDQQFQFDADLDGNGTTETAITYEVLNGDLQRSLGGTSVTLIRDLSTLDFDYVDLNGTTMSTPVNPQSNRDTIRLVQVTITATKDGETLSVADAAYLRNR